MPVPHWGLFQKYGNQYNVDPMLLANIARAESGFNPNATSGAGAVGLMQFMPGTFKAMGVGNDPRNVRQSIQAGAKYMSQLLNQFGGDTRLALAGYNAGGGAARKALQSYPETKAYVNRVLGGAGGGTNASFAGSGSDSQALAAAVGNGLPANLTPAQKRLLAAPTSFDDTPWKRGSLESPIIAQMKQMAEAQMASAGGGGEGGGEFYQQGIDPYNGKMAFVPRLPGEQGYQYLNRIGGMFGLQHDPGNGQTTGGQHSGPGSLHYRGQAVDYGTGRNSVAALQAYQSYLNKYRNQIGLSQLMWENPGTSNSHVHAATSRGRY